MDGALQVSAHAWGQNVSMGGKTVYGTLWYGEKLPLDGVAIEWTYMYPDARNAHDMNWWF